MSTTTSNLGLFKYDVHTDTNVPFSITKALNNNWDIIDEKYACLNNPYSLFDSKYSDHELNNLSWLKSEGQWNAKAVYTDAYDKLLKVYNGTETVEGLSVKLSTETYTDYDFVLNTTDETFRLPLLDGSEDLPSNRYANLEFTSYGQGVKVPANGWVTFLRSGGATNQFIQLNNSKIFVSGTNGSYTNFNMKETIFAKRGDTVKVEGSATGTINQFAFIYAQGNGSLYYYVGETVQNANLIDAGRIGEQLANLITVVEAYKNGTSGYRIWSDGYCEQWGEYGTKITGSSNVDITLMKAYNSTNFNVQITGKMNRTSSVSGYYVITGSVLSTNSIRIYNDADSSAGLGAYWKTSGYLAVGQY